MKKFRLLLIAVFLLTCSTVFTNKSYASENKFVCVYNQVNGRNESWLFSKPLPITESMLFGTGPEGLHFRERIENDWKKAVSKLNLTGVDDYFVKCSFWPDNLLIPHDTVINNGGISSMGGLAPIPDGWLTVDLRTLPTASTTIDQNRTKGPGTLIVSAPTGGPTAAQKAAQEAGAANERAREQRIERERQEQIAKNAQADREAAARNQRERQRVLAEEERQRACQAQNGRSCPARKKAAARTSRR